jgi:transposase-like protein
MLYRKRETPKKLVNLFKSKNNLTKQRSLKMKDTNNKQKNLEWLKSQNLDYQISLFQDYTEIMKIVANNLMESSIEEKCGERYKHQSPEERRYTRWGYNPGSIKVGDEKVKLEVPRYLDRITNKAQNNDAYGKLKEQESPNEKMIKSVLLGLSQKDYGLLSRTMAESFGLSQSTISRKFIEESSAALKEFEQRDLGKYDFVGLMIDGKYLVKEQIVICMGITINGDKLLLGFIQTTTENSKSVKELLKNLLERNFRFEEGLLCLLDGSKGLNMAVKETFGKYCLIQRCQWHKRENVVSYLSGKDALIFRAKLQSAYSEPEYEKAKTKLIEIGNELSKINRSAANSLKEGLEETLTLHRLGLAAELGRSLTTTNSIENVNSKLGSYLRKIKHWKTPDMLARWIAMGLIETESRMRKINNHKKLYLLKDALRTELKLKKTRVA